jgi:hypothetical protein
MHFYIICLLICIFNSERKKERKRREEKILGKDRMGIVGLRRWDYFISPLTHLHLDL